MNAAQRILIQIEVESKIASERMRLMAKQTEAFQQRMRKLSGVMLSVGLSTLFFGMAMKNMATTALRSVMNTMQQISGEMDHYSVQTNRLSANWAFFKFTLMDALMQTGLFDIMINALIRVIRWMSDLSPTTKSTFMVLLGFLAVAGGTMMFFGTIISFVSGLMQILGVTSVTSLTKIGSIAAVALGRISVLATAIYLSYKLINAEGNQVVSFLASLATIGLLIGAIFGMWPLIAIAGVALLALVFKEELGILFGFIIGGFLEVGDLIVDALLLPLKGVLWAAGKLAEILGMENATRNISALSNMIDGLSNSLDNLSAKNNARIDELFEQRRNRGDLMDRLGVTDPTAGITAPIQGIIDSMPTGSVDSSSTTTNYNVGTIISLDPSQIGSNTDNIQAEIDKALAKFGGAPLGGV